MSNDSFKPLGPLRKRVDSSGVTQGIVDEQGETVSLGGAGSGDVTKVGTPANNQVGVWTGDGTLEGTADLTYDGTSLNLVTGKNFQIAGATVLADAAGTTTLSNIDALDATTEATIEAAIDTLANLTSVQGVTVTLADAGADAIFGWDDSAGAYANLSAADARTALGLATTDSPQFTAVNVGAASDTTITRTGAGDIAVEGNAIYRAGGTDVPLADGGTGASLADPNADRIMFWDDSAGAVAWLTAGSGLSISGTSMTATATGFPTVEAIATGSAYTLTTGDANKIKLGQDSSAQTINITTAFDGLGCWIQWLAGAGTITLDANAGVNLNGLGDGVNIVLSQAAGMVQIIPTGTNTWNVVGAIGDLVATDVTDSTSAGRTLLTAADAAAQRTALSVVGKQLIPIMAAGMSPSATGGCAALATIASAANQPDIQSLDFDATTEEYAQFAIPMPESWDEGTLTFAPIWSHASTTTNFGVVWSLQAVAVSNDDAIAVAFGTAVTSTDTGGTTNDVYVGPESAAMTVAGTPQAGDMVFFRIFRTPANGSDTMAIDARLHGIRLYYTSNAAIDA